MERVGAKRGFVTLLVGYKDSNNFSFAYFERLFLGVLI